MFFSCNKVGCESQRCNCYWIIEVIVHNPFGNLSVAMIHYINPQEYLCFDTLDFNEMSLIAMVLASKKLQCNQPVLHFVVGHWETQGTDGKLQFAASHSWKHVAPNSLRAEDESKSSHKYPGWYSFFLNLWWQNSFANLVYTHIIKHVTKLWWVFKHYVLWWRHAAPLEIWTTIFSGLFVTWYAVCLHLFFPNTPHWHVYIELSTNRD